MIFTSNLLNDGDMIRALGSMAIPVALFTDACFSSIDGKVIACERKKVGDMASCVLGGRFLFQMQNCKAADCDYLVLILEGRYRRNPDDGLLEVPVWVPYMDAKGQHRRREEWQPVKPTTMFSRFDQYLTELQRDAGILIKHTENVRGTADTILALYQNFQTPQSEHKSLNQIFKPPTPSVQLVRPSLVRRIASELPNIGWSRSGVVAEHFTSVKAMVDADVKEWSSLDGIGKKTAQKVFSSLRQK